MDVINKRSLGATEEFQGRGRRGRSVRLWGLHG